MPACARRSKRRWTRAEGLTLGSVNPAAPRGCQRASLLCGVAFGLGLGLGLGLGISLRVDPRKVLGFLDLAGAQRPRCMDAPPPSASRARSIAAGSSLMMPCTPQCHSARACAG